MLVMRMILLLLLVVTALPCGSLIADDEINANPNRPTVSNPADITQYGVLEMEYGITAAEGGQELGGLIKFAAGHDFELRIDNVPFQNNSVDSVSGFGDLGLGFQYRFLRQSGNVPSMAVAYSLKVPTASSGLGSGKYDHQIIYLVSKDLGGFHADFNVDFEFLGREGQSGHDIVAAPALAVSHSFGRFTIAGEISGTSRQNDSTPSTVSTLWALSYNVSSRCVLDTAVSFGLKGDVLDRTYLAGITFSIAKLYHHR